jgi:hypothetical protein
VAVRLGNIMILVGAAPRLFSSRGRGSGDRGTRAAGGRTSCHRGVGEERAPGRASAGTRAERAGDARGRDRRAGEPQRGEGGGRHFSRSTRTEKAAPGAGSRPRRREPRGARGGAERDAREARSGRGDRASRCAGVPNSRGVSAGLARRAQRASVKNARSAAVLKKSPWRRFV